MKVFEALADAFARELAGPCFALLGDANMHWAGALSDRGCGFIYTRHEHAAVAAATAFARTRGEVGCATVTCGPGLTQVMTILPIAARARVPLVVFAGEAPLNKAWYNQGIDQAPFVAACGAEYRALHDPVKMIAEVHRAFDDARRLKAPIILGVPFDLQQEAWKAAPEQLCFSPAPKPRMPDSHLVAQACAYIENAERPILLAGLGAAGARSACIDLARKAGALLATTLPAKGLFWDQPFCLGVAGGFATERSKAIFAEADLVIGIGTRLASHTFDGGKLTPNARVLHVDLEPQVHVQGRKAADLLIASDAQLGATAIADGMVSRPGWRNAEMERKCAAALDLPAQHQTPDGLLHPMAVVRALDKAIPRDCHVVNTSGHSAYYTAQMNRHPHDRFTVIREFGAIGNGTSFAIGVAAAHPEQKVILLDGDGSALMHIQELETIVRHRLNILVIVLNDGAYGSEVHKLRADGMSLAGSVFGRPDFAEIGHGFGLTGKTFTSLECLPKNMDEFLSSGAPAIWDVRISNQIASPQILKAHKAAHDAPTV